MTDPAVAFSNAAWIVAKGVAADVPSFPSRPDGLTNSAGPGAGGGAGLVPEPLRMTTVSTASIARMTAASTPTTTGRRGAGGGLGAGGAGAERDMRPFRSVGSPRATSPARPAQECDRWLVHDTAAVPSLAGLLWITVAVDLRWTRSGLGPRRCRVGAGWPGPCQAAAAPCTPRPTRRGSSRTGAGASGPAVRRLHPKRCHAGRITEPILFCNVQIGPVDDVWPDRAQW